MDWKQRAAEERAKARARVLETCERAGIPVPPAYTAGAALRPPNEAELTDLSLAFDLYYSQGTWGPLKRLNMVLRKRGVAIPEGYRFP